MKTAKFAGLIVDLAGTLVRPNPPVREQYRREARKLLPESQVPSESFIEERWKTAYYKLSVPRGELRYGTTFCEGFWFWKRLIGCVFPAVGDRVLDQLTEKLFNRFARAESWSVFEGARETLGKLRNHEIRTGLVSNWDRRCSDLLQELELDEFFDAVCISSEVGVEKPAPGLFEEALDRLDLRPSQTGMVGNSVRQDLEPARKMGIEAVLFDPSGSSEWSPSVRNWKRLGKKVFDKNR